MHGERIRQARELSALTQTELAQRTGITQPAIAQIESGVFIPSDSVLQAIALQTGFEIGFLKQEKPPAEFPIGSFLYRSQAKVTTKDKARAHRIAQLMFEIASTMRSKLRDIPILIPRTSEPTEDAARIARASLGFSPESPLTNFINALERAGVLVLQIPLEVDGLDAFSSWVGLNHDIPVICMLSGKKGYRYRFTLGEELCHLIKHNPLRCTVPEADSEARQFAGELLLPEEVIREEISEPVTISGLWSHRNRYQVSLQFLIRRVLDLGIISPNQYKYLNMQVSSRGWKKQEPGDVDVIQERPRMFVKMVEVVYGNPPNLQQMKKDTAGVPIPLLRSLLGNAPADRPDPSGKVISFYKRAS